MAAPRGSLGVGFARRIKWRVEIILTSSPSMVAFTGGPVLGTETPLR